MLVLSRKIGEKIVIDGNITVTIVRIEGGRVRFGIEAPKEIKIRRAEIPIKDPNCGEENKEANCS